MSRGSNSLAGAPEHHLSWIWPSTGSPARAHYPRSKVSALGLWEFAGQKQSLVMPRRTCPLAAACSGRGCPIFGMHQPPHLATLSSFPRTGIALQCSPKRSPSLCSSGALQGCSPQSCTPGHSLDPCYCAFVLCT